MGDDLASPEVGIRHGPGGPIGGAARVPAAGGRHQPMTTPLALPPAGRTRPKNLINMATLVVVTGGTALFAVLIAAYVGVGHGSRVWPPSGVNIDEYMGNMLALTAIMSATTVE